MMHIQHRLLMISKKLGGQLTHVVNILKSYIFISALILIVVFINKNWAAFSSTISTLPITSLSLIVLCHVLFCLINALILKKTTSNLSSFNTNTTINCLYINSVSSIAGFLMPSGAIATKIVLIKQRLNLSYKNSFQAVAAISGGYFLASCIVTVFLAIFFAINANREVSLFIKKHNLYLIALSCILLTILTVLFIKYLWPLRWIGSRVKKNDVRPRLNSYTLRTIATLILLSVIQNILIAASLFFYGNELNINRFIAICTLSTINSLLSLVPITPGNIGVREGLFYITSPHLGVEPDIIVIISLVDRALQLTLLFCIVGTLSCFTNYKTTK